MINELFQERAALYVSGAMTVHEREQFELVMEYHDALREFVHELSEVCNALHLTEQPSCGAKPSRGLKSRILESLCERPQQTAPEGIVVSRPDRVVEWVNPAFTAMCGYTLEELRGKKLGPVLQGEKTDRATAERIRNAISELRPCRETILNYHKCGDTYWVEIAITPILDDDGHPIWLMARERELLDCARV